MGITTDPNHPGVGWGIDEGPVPMNDDYLVLSEQLRAKGFARPLRHSYLHTTCPEEPGARTWMHPAIAETYAREPRFYGSTYCCACKRHRPVAEFTWALEDGTDTGAAVGS